MYKCIGCEGVVDKAGHQCICGKLLVNKRGKVSGENYLKIGELKKEVHVEKSKVRKCPKCGWQGLVVPRIGLGCPDHGVWYKNEKELNPEKTNGPSRGKRGRGAASDLSPCGVKVDVHDKTGETLFEAVPKRRKRSA